MRALLLLALLATPACAQDITVFAASSLKTALDQIAADYETQTGTQISLTYAGSNALAKQIIDGAPADIFISAAPNWMDAATQSPPLKRQDLLANALVLIAPAPAEPIDLAQLPAALGSQKLAMAMVDAVPAGQYGKAALQTLGLWDQLAPHVAQTENVRAALALVSRGEAAYAVVYKSDAQSDPSVSTVATFPDSPAIRFPAALLTPKGLPFFDALTTPKSRATFTAQGFTPLP